MIDLSTLTWCEPAAIVGIACLVETEVRAGKSVTVTRPRQRNVANYLARMRLGNMLSALGANHDLPAVDERDSDALLELRLFNGSRGAEQLARLVDRELRATEPDAAGALWEGICETGQNVEQHSGQRFGFVAAQRYRATSRSRQARFLFAVGDSGRGMLDSLAVRGATAHDQAIRMSLTPGLSEEDDPSRGSGLPTINQYLRELGGGLHVVTGTAVVSTHAPRRRSWTADLGICGTVVQGEIRR